MQQIVENYTHKSGNCHEKGNLKNGTTPYHGQVKLPPGLKVEWVSINVFSDLQTELRSSDLVLKGTRGDLAS